MRVGFMGTPAFAVPALLALHDAGHEIACVYTQMPRPAGRGQQVRASPVQQAAGDLGIPVRTPLRLRRDTDAQAAFAALRLDVGVVAAYGLILPPPMLAAPVHGCINIHASLLPRWRGAGPIQAAILAGDGETGITIMQMAAGLDTGPMLLQGTVPIGPRDNASQLHDQLAELGARLIVETLARAPHPVPQDEEFACTAPMLSREDGRIDWRQDAYTIDRRIRAMHPWPGAFTMLGETVLKIAAATPLPEFAQAGVPGEVLDDRLAVACGSGALRIERLQWPGRGMLEATAFLRGRALPRGTGLG